MSSLKEEACWCFELKSQFDVSANGELTLFYHIFIPEMFEEFHFQARIAVAVLDVVFRA